MRSAAISLLTLFIPAKIALFTALLTFSLSAHAEYYFACEGPIMWTYCPSGGCVKKHRHHYPKVKKKHTYHRVYRSEIVNVYVVPACGGCSGCCAGREESAAYYWRYGNTYPPIYGPYVQDYYPSPRDAYDPDLSTGDDNASVYPGMDIDE